MPKFRGHTKAGRRAYLTKVFHGLKHGSIKSSSGKRVRSQAQRIAIALSLAGLSRKK
jgi:hypothetical protein